MPQAVSWLQTTDVGWVRSDLVLTVPLTSIARLSVLVLASDYVGNYSVWSITDVAENYSTAALAVIGSPMRVSQHNNTAGASTWDVRLVAVGADLRVEVYGAASKIIDWHVDVDVSLLITRRSITSPLLTNLISYWKLDETSDGSVPVTRVDSVTTNDFTDTNTVTSNPGIVTTSAQFTAANSEYLSHASNASLSVADGDFSLACWVYLDSKSTRMDFLSKTLGGDGWTLRYDNGLDRFQFLPYIAADYRIVQADTFGSPSTATWYFVAAWHDSVGDSIGIKVNATASDTLAVPTGGPGTTTASFKVSSYDGTQNFMNGRVNEVGFWKRVLSSSDLVTLYNGGIGVSHPFS